MSQSNVVLVELKRDEAEWLLELLETFSSMKAMFPPALRPPTTGNDASIPEAIRLALL